MEDETFFTLKNSDIDNKTQVKRLGTNDEVYNHNPNPNTNRKYLQF